jgi:hypothetical protein
MIVVDLRQVPERPQVDPRTGTRCGAARRRAPSIVSSPPSAKTASHPSASAAPGRRGMSAGRRGSPSSPTSDTPAVAAHAESSSTARLRSRSGLSTSAICFTACASGRCTSATRTSPYAATKAVLGTAPSGKGSLARESAPDPVPRGFLLPERLRAIQVERDQEDVLADQRGGLGDDRRRASKVIWGVMLRGVLEHIADKCLNHVGYRRRVGRGSACGLRPDRVGEDLAEALVAHMERLEGSSSR